MNIILKFICVGIIATNVLMAKECVVKLIPKMDIILVITNYKTDWESVNALSFEDCKAAAEKKLKIANTPKKLETFDEVMDDYWTSLYLPEYFKGVKAKFTNDAGKVTRYVRHL